MVRPLGDADQAHVLDPQILEHFPGGVELAASAVDQHQIGPGAALPIGILLLRAGEAAREHFAHHAEIVAGDRFGALDVELAILVLAKPSGPATIIAPSALVPWMWLLS